MMDFEEHDDEGHGEDETCIARDPGLRAANTICDVLDTYVAVMRFNQGDVSGEKAWTMVRAIVGNIAARMAFSGTMTGASQDHQTTARKILHDAIDEGWDAGTEQGMDAMIPPNDRDGNGGDGSQHGGN